MTTFDLTATIWGVRGSVPVPGPHTVRYGGNTPCMEIQTPDETIVIDAGTGIRNFAKNLSKDKANPRKITILLSHTHWDHIQGLPFLPIAYDPSYQIDIIGPRRPGINLHEALERQMESPNFPVPFSALAAVKSVIEVTPGETIQLASTTVDTAQLNHPDISMGFRIERGGKSIAYCLDHEHEDEVTVHAGLEALARDADLLVYDAAYDDLEYSKFKGWGHSTWQMGRTSAAALNVQTLILAGYNPDATDDDLDRINDALEGGEQNTVLAKEGMSFQV